MNQATDVLIIGGGVIGTAIAYNLRTRGIDVSVLERGEVGSQASSAAAGLLAPLGTA
jgi:glycine oxidase